MARRTDPLSTLRRSNSLIVLVPRRVDVASMGEKIPRLRLEVVSSGGTVAYDGNFSTIGEVLLSMLLFDDFVDEDVDENFSKGTRTS